MMLHQKANNDRFRSYDSEIAFGFKDQKSIALAIRIKRGTVSPETIDSKTQLLPEKLLSTLSFSHFVELIEVEDMLKRNFYEVETPRLYNI